MQQRTVLCWGDGLFSIDARQHYKQLSKCICHSHSLLMGMAGKWLEGFVSRVAWITFNAVHVILDIYLAYKVQVNQTTVLAGSRGWVQQGNISMACNKGIIIGHKQAGIAIDVLIGMQFNCELSAFHSVTLMLFIKNIITKQAVVSRSPLFISLTNMSGPNGWVPTANQWCQQMQSIEIVEGNFRSYWIGLDDWDLLLRCSLGLC